MKKELETLEKYIKDNELKQWYNGVPDKYKNEDRIASVCGKYIDINIYPHFTFVLIQFNDLYVESYWGK